MKDLIEWLRNCGDAFLWSCIYCASLLSSLRLKIVSILMTKNYSWIKSRYVGVCIFNFSLLFFSLTQGPKQTLVRSKYNCALLKWEENFVSAVFVLQASPRNALSFRLFSTYLSIYFITVIHEHLLLWFMQIIILLSFSPGHMRATPWFINNLIEIQFFTLIYLGVYYCRYYYYYYAMKISLLH